MKLRRVLVLAFLTLTLIPIITVSLLLYKSGYELSKESYIRNLTESISVQADYIVQSMDSDMISDYRFAQQNSVSLHGSSTVTEKQEKELYEAFQKYLQSSEDKLTASFILDSGYNSIYTIGEAAILEKVRSSLPPLSQIDRQSIMEFELEPGDYSLAILTPIRGADNTDAGCLVSIYDKAYLFKIISSYYKIADTSTYICRANGDAINFRALPDEQQNEAIQTALAELSFSTEGVIDMEPGGILISGYYKKIGYTPWYLVGFIDDQLVSDFTNQYIITYILIIMGVFFVDLVLAIYFSRRVVEPINSLIQVMEGYPDTINRSELQVPEKLGYFETQFLRTKFLELMERILLVQHNFEGVYQLYQSGLMSDTNIDIDTIKQTIYSNKETFQKLMNELKVPPESCIVEQFINCFGEKDQRVLMDIFENMRDRHLSVPCEVEVYTPHWEEKWFHILVVPMYENDCLSHLFIQLRDISSFKRQEFESSEKAIRDSLTGLYNRSGFTQYAEAVLQEADPLALHGLLFIDMDYFKMVNDNLGHVAGDELLRSVGGILLDTVQHGISSRFGGDEFAVFLPNTSHEAIQQVKRVLCERLVYPYSTAAIDFVITASIGVSVWSGDSPHTLEELLNDADAAMYQAKKRVK